MGKEGDCKCIDCLCAAIEENIEDEASAREGYYKLLCKLTDTADRDIIREIISDELNHSDKLREMVKKYSKIKEATD